MRPEMSISHRLDGWRIEDKLGLVNQNPACFVFRQKFFVFSPLSLQLWCEFTTRVSAKSRFSTFQR
jgi:hypothetical protein